MNNKLNKILAIKVLSVFFVLSPLVAHAEQSCNELSRSLTSENKELKDRINELEADNRMIQISKVQLQEALNKKTQESQFYEYKFNSIRTMMASSIAKQEGLKSNLSDIDKLKSPEQVAPLLSKASDYSDSDNNQYNQKPTQESDYNYASSNWVQLSSPKPVVLAVDGGNIREKPSVNANIIGKTKKGDFLLISHKSKKGTWFKVKDKNEWLYQSLVKFY